MWDTLVAALEDLKDIDHPVVLHIHTTKGLASAMRPRRRMVPTDATRPIRSRMPANARRIIGRIRIARSASRLTRANTTVRWPWLRWSPVSKTSRDWWSSPPPPLVRMASPVISVNVRIALCGHRHYRGACGRVRRRHREGWRPAGSGDFRHVLPAYLRPVAAGAGVESCSGDAADFRSGYFRRGQYIPARSI